MFKPDATATVGGTRYSDVAAILESFPANIAYLDRGLVYRYVNSQYEALFGRPREDIVGRHVVDVLGEEAFAVAGPRLRSALDGEVFSYESEFRFPGREACWLAVHYVPDRLSDGGIRGLFVFAVDITRRRRAERDLGRVEVRYQALYEHCPIGIGYYDGEGRILQLNRHAVAEFGLGDGDVAGMTLAQILGDEVAAPFVERMRVVLETGVSQEHLDEVVLPGGTKWFLSDYAVVPAIAGGACGIQVVSRDITALRRAEKEQHDAEMRLRQAQKMQAVGVLAGGVAHDFNNILQTVLGFTLEMLDDQALSAAHREDLDVVRDACRRGASLTSQLLAFSRQQVLAPKILDANEVVHSVAKMIRRLIGEHVTLVVEAGAADTLVHADEGQMSQILLNLAVNARDAMPHGGCLTISTGRRCVASAPVNDGDPQPGEYVELTVADTGCGMSPQVRERIFEPFFTTKDVGAGTGLGLATVFGIVRQHGGYIDVDSAPGDGTVFRVGLPLFRERFPAGDRGDAPAVVGGHETILLAEDDPGVRTVIERRLSRAGYHVLSAGDGIQADALHEAHHACIDLALLDVVMPGCGGRQAFESMLRRDPNLKVLFLSGYLPVDIGVGAATPLAGPLLRKPFTPEDLCRAVRGVLDGAMVPS